MKITRRQAIRLAGSGVLCSPLSLPQAAWAQLGPAVPRFEMPLKFPALLTPTKQYDVPGKRPIDCYEITMRKAKVKILPGVETEMWCYVGKGLEPAAIGPIIRHRGGIQPQDQGRTSVIRFINELGTTLEKGKPVPIDTSIHLHGMASLPQYDGYAEDLIAPGYFKDYKYPNDRAATLWFHDHAVHKTSRNVYMGLVGMYVVEDEVERQLNLPKGDYDVPLIIQDKKFDQEGQLIFDDRRQRSAYGNVILVNGTPFPKFSVERRKYRFRLLNASPSRTYQLVLSQDEHTLTSGQPLTVIGSDAGLLDIPVTLKSPYNLLKIGVGERYEVVIDFAQYPKGSKLYLHNPIYSNNIDSTTSTDVIMRFDIDRDAVSDVELPQKLRPIERLADKVTPSQNIPVRTFRFERNSNEWKINGRTWDPNYVAANPAPGAIEIWRLVNPGAGWVHPVHIHLVDLQMIDRNGLPPRSYERGWKDVFTLDDGETIRVIAKFGSPSGVIQGKYMMHCHNLVHEDHDMMAQFEVGQGGPDPLSDRAKPISQMQPL